MRLSLSEAYACCFLLFMATGAQVSTNEVYRELM